MRYEVANWGVFGHHLGRVVGYVVATELVVIACKKKTESCKRQISKGLGIDKALFSYPQFAGPGNSGKNTGSNTS